MLIHQIVEYNTEISKVLPTDSKPFGAVEKKIALKTMLWWIDEKSLILLTETNKILKERLKML